MSSDLLPVSFSDEALLAACVTPAVIAGVFVLIRLANGWKIAGRFHLDDWMAILALVFIVALAVLSYLGTILPNNPNTPLATTPKLFTALQWISPASLYFGKAPLLIMVLRIFENSRWVKVNSYIILAGSAILFLGGAIYYTARCSTAGTVVTVDYVAKCLQTGLALGTWNGAVAVASDIIILCIPFPVVSKLNLPTNKKIGLLLLFFTGIFTLITSAVTLYFKISGLTGKSVSIIGSVIGALLEAIIALIVSCLPAIRSLWLAHVSDSYFYTSLKSLVTSRSRKTEVKLTSYPSPGASNEESALPASHAYIELPESRFRRTADESYSGNV